MTGALFEGLVADVERAHGLPGDLLVVGAADIDQRPSLAHVRCPVAVVPPLTVSAEEPWADVGPARTGADVEPVSVSGERPGPARTPSPAGPG